MAGPETVLVVAAGRAEDFPRGIEPAELTIAADAGLHLAVALGVEPDIVIGDLDSVDADALAAAEQRGAEVVRHPAAKDQTDLELALERAVAHEPARVHVVVSGGGRLDHAVANLAVLASPRWARAEVTADVGAAQVWVVRGRRELALAVGDPLALQPIGGPAGGVRTTGLRWTLAGETLGPYAARGVANEVVSSPVTVELDDGVLLAISAPTPPTGPGGARDRG